MDSSNNRPIKAARPNNAATLFENLKGNEVQHEPNSSEWLTSKQAAEYLGISVGSLNNMVSSGSIPYYKLGKRNRYLRSELRSLLLANKRGVF